MSKRKGSSLHRQSKRHKSDHYNDGKTDLQRELEIYDQTQNQQEQDEFHRAQQEVQRQQQLANINNNTIQSSYTSSGIALGTPLSDDDEDDDIDVTDYHQPNNIRTGDSDSDYHDQDEQHNYVHPERSAQMQQYSSNSTDYSATKHHEPKSERETVTVTHDVEALTLRDLRNHQMTRKSLEKICCEPFFSAFIGRDEESSLPGLFCRIYIGDRETSSGQREAIYRVCEMIGTEDWRRSYHLTDRKRTTNVGLLIAHGSAERVFKITQTSNTAFTEKEFIQWKQTMRDDGLPLPTKDELSESYLNAAKRHKNFKYDEEAIAIIREKRNKNFNAAELANPHKEALRINTLIASLGDEDIEERQRLERYSNDINAEIERRNTQQSQSIKVSIASINEKNKIKNKKLMLKAREKERKMQMKNKGKSQMNTDPFTRAITAPKIESFVHDEMDINEVKKEEKEEKKEEKKKICRLQQNVRNNDDDINNLSILKHRIKKKSGLSSNDDNNVNNMDNVLWRHMVHCVAKEFVDKCQNIVDIDTFDVKNKQPQFGRNTNKSKYANKYMRKPNNVQIISIDHYLQTKKYSTM